MRHFPVTVLQDCNEVGHGSQYQFKGLKADKQYGGPCPLVIHTASHNITWGDYSLAGHEDVLAVERKTLSDLFGTLGGRRDSFEVQVEAMSHYKAAIIAVEADWKDVYESPPKNSQMEPSKVGRTIISWAQRWPTVQWHFWSNRALAEKLTFRYLERYWINLMDEKQRSRFRYPLLQPGSVAV